MLVPDTALWEAIQRDDISAFTALYERYWRRLFTAAFAQLKDRDACQELVHDVFLTLWTERARLQVAAPAAYLAAAVYYQAIRSRRTAHASRLHYADELDTLSTASAHNEGETKLLGLDLEGRLATALDQLPQRCREIFLLSRIQHFSNEEIAERLHISRRSVENQLTTALRHLRLTLKGLSGIWLLIYLGQG